MYEHFHGIQRTAAAVCAAGLMLTAMPGREAAAEDALRLMCLGDSITDGFWLPGGYRNTLCGLISENGQERRVTMAGPNWGGSGYDPRHAGYSGYSIDNIAQEDSISGGRVGISSFAEWLMTEHPADLVFLQIGTNDILSLYDLEHFGDRLEGLVDIILDALPDDGCLYLATLPVMDATNNLYISDYFFTVESMDAAVADCNAQIRALAERKRQAGARIVLADMNAVLTKADLYDGVHPSEAGYEKMGRFWYGKLAAHLDGSFVLPEPGTQTTAPAETTTTTTTTTETTAPPAAQSGDVNGDGRRDMADAVLLARYLLTEGTLTPAQAAQADMDTNGRLNAVDLSLLKRAL